MVSNKLYSDPEFVRKHVFLFWLAGCPIPRKSKKNDSGKSEAEPKAKPLGVVEDQAERCVPGSSKGASAPKERSYDPSTANFPSLAVADTKQQDSTAKPGPAIDGPVKDEKKEQPKAVEEPKPVQKDDNKAASEAKDNKGSSKPASEGKANNRSGKPDHSFNDDEDKQLLEMKSNGDTWKDIAKKLGKPQGLVKKRFNELSTDEQKGETQEKASGKQQSANECKNCACQAKEAKAEKVQDKKDAAEQEAAPAVANQGAPNPAGNSPGEGDIRTMEDLESDRGYFVLYPDAVFSEDDCEALARAVYSDYEDYHLRLASRIFDRTGHRISAQAVKIKLGGRDRRV